MKNTLFAQESVFGIQHQMFFINLPMKANPCVAVLPTFPTNTHTDSGHRGRRQRRRKRYTHITASTQAEMRLDADAESALHTHTISVHKAANALDLFVTRREKNTAPMK